MGTLRALILVVALGACAGGCSHSKATRVTRSAETAAVSEKPGTGAAATCEDAVRSGSASEVVTAFRAARIAGHGAEGCVTDNALIKYCGPRNCGPELFSGANAPSPG